MPQTKEDILLSKESISDNFVSYYPWKSALEAMDEYAKQMVMAFALRPFKPEMAKQSLVDQINEFFDSPTTQTEQ